jgi:hypothetical protein
MPFFISARSYKFNKAIEHDVQRHSGKEEKYWSEYKAIKTDDLTDICETIV